jgi:hypothetical protein
LIEIDVPYVGYVFHLKPMVGNLSPLPYTPLKKHVGWMSPRQQDITAPLSLTDELMMFARYVQLNDYELASREGLMQDIEEAIHSKWAHAVVNPFGSYVAGLSTFQVTTFDRFFLVFPPCL